MLPDINKNEHIPYQEINKALNREHEDEDGEEIQIGKNVCDDSEVKNPSNGNSKY